MDNPAVKGFVAKADVWRVMVVHRNLIKGQANSPYVTGSGGSKSYFLKESQNVEVKGSYTKLAAGKKLITYEYKKTGRASYLTGKITVSGTRGINHVRLVRTNLKTRAFAVVHLHVTVYEDVPDKTAYLTKEAKTFHCHEAGCTSRTLPAGQRITILARVNRQLRISYTINKKEEIRYVNESDCAYVSMNPVIIRAKSSTQRAVSYKHMVENERTYKAVSVADFIKAEFLKDGKVKLAHVYSRKSHGYATLKVTVGNRTGKPVRRYMAYTPVSVYEPMAQTIGYIRKDTAFRDGSSDSRFCSTMEYLKKERRVTMLGRSGSYYYVQAGAKKGFVRCADVVFVEVSRTYATINRDTNAPSEVRVIIHNANGGSWRNGGTVVSFQPQKSRQPIRYKTGEILYVRDYHINSERTGRADTSYILQSLRSRLFVSVYSRIKVGRTIEGYVKTNTTIRRTAGTVSYVKAYGTLTQYKKINLIGECGDWFYVKRLDTGKGVWIPKSRVVYLTLNRYQGSLYQYHKDSSIKAYVHNKAVDAVKWSSNNKNIVSVQENNGIMNSSRAGTASVVATHYYNNGKNSIKATARVTVKPVHITIHTTEKMYVKMEQKDTIDKRRAYIYTYPEYVLSGKVFTLPDAYVNWSSGSSKILKLDKFGRNYKITGHPTKEGTITVTAKYRDVTATKKVRLKPLTIIIESDKFPYAGIGGGSTLNGNGGSAGKGNSGTVAIPLPKGGTGWSLTAVLGSLSAAELAAAILAGVVIVGGVVVLVGTLAGAKKHVSGTNGSAIVFNVNDKPDDSAKGKGQSASEGSSGAGGNGKKPKKKKDSQNTVSKQNADKWHKGTFDSVKSSLKYHFSKHGSEVGASSIEQYVRKAVEFLRQIKGAKKYYPQDGTPGAIRYVKNGKYVTVAPDGRILSFGNVR